MWEAVFGFDLLYLHFKDFFWCRGYEHLLYSTVSQQMLLLSVRKEMLLKIRGRLVKSMGAVILLVLWGAFPNHTQSSEEAWGLSRWGSAVG